MRHLKPEEAYKILVRYYEGEPLGSLLEEFNISRRTFYRLKQEWKENEMFTKKTRTRSTTVRGDVLNQVRNYITNIDTCATRDEIICKFDLPISKATLSRYIHMMGLRGQVAPKKFKLNNIDEQRRIDTALAWRSLSVEEWKRYVFIDESGLDNSPTISRNIWRPKSTNRHNPDFSIAAENSTCRVNFFSWVSWHGTGQLFFYEKMNSETFCEIVPKMIEKLRQEFEGENFIIVLDNASFHKSNYCKDRMSELGFTKFFLLLPAYSPDINIIENLWGIVKRRVRKFMFVNGQIRDKVELCERIEIEWRGVQAELIHELYESLPRRMRQIVAADGKLIKY